MKSNILIMYNFKKYINRVNISYSKNTSGGNQSQNEKICLIMRKLKSAHIDSVQNSNFKSGTLIEE